ncbi:ankyrin repeat domain-containing protein [Rickettsia endosymbiont of Gonocerus acuteangulatus]|uniref:ankyrin repeat domain-containing protein n=1 Tax=Rickettsia endosymbiont of Gonocerus acuteangulatus TaxID=3066266 RepID=UPI003132AC8A
MTCGADINARTQYTKMTSLLYAAFYKDIKLVKELIELGADVNVNNTYGSSVLESIVRKGDIELTKELVKLGANVHVMHDVCGTLLHAAAFSGNLELVRYVIEELGVNDVHARDMRGYTPRDLAKQKGNVNIEQFLMEQECSANMIQDISSLSCHNILYDNIYIPPPQSKVLNNVVSITDNSYERNDVLEHCTLSGIHTDFDDTLRIGTTFGI